MHKVLIIEDEPAYLKIYKRKFEVSGYQVEIASDGEEGLVKMRSFQPDIVFLDLMMPKKDGFQVLDETQADPLLKDIPKVVLTNLSTAEDAEKVLAKGALKIMVKSDSEPNAIVHEANDILGVKSA